MSACVARGTIALILGAAITLVGTPNRAQSPSRFAVPDAPSPSTSSGTTGADTVAVTIRTRSDGRCQNDGGCLVGVLITPTGSDTPVVQGSLDPEVDATGPNAFMEVSLDPGTYAVLITAMALAYGDPEPSAPDSGATPFGGCGTTLALAPGQQVALIVASMAWEQAACGIVIEPHPSFNLQRPVLADPIVADDEPPRFRPRGAPTATATANGLRLDLWVQDPTLEQGQWLLAHARVTNLGRNAIRYVDRFERQDCPPLRYTADVSDLFDPGRTWTGIAARYKERFIGESPLLRAPLRSPTCDRTGADVGIGKRLEPGASLDVPLAGMLAYMLAGQPLPPGAIHVTVAYQDPRPRRPDLVAVTTDVTLDGDPVSYPSPGQLVDAALATPGFVDALALAPDPTDWANADDWWPTSPYPPQPHLDGARDAPDGIVEIEQIVGSDIEVPFMVGAALDPWTGESFGSYWF
jgi:hypothetical protein